ncbi:hypothetical protein GCK72_017450 [Caenorhabditis remanei]|uniref:Uncharacterized protein n=1 Tax=Caenorhabditis remanei TaxID=31234 RepID=A0A6A5G8P5_CAERE|nr:hypothetical protein GCK72_017450 [Caenorhabditis remanei]KAF1750899.1 hypothetical protein GCK72_017450 [Caenorhabditis remanei]
MDTSIMFFVESFHLHGFLIREKSVPKSLWLWCLTLLSITWSQAVIVICRKSETEFCMFHFEHIGHVEEEQLKSRRYYRKTSNRGTPVARVWCTISQMP